MIEINSSSKKVILSECKFKTFSRSSLSVIAEYPEFCTTICTGVSWSQISACEQSSTRWHCSLGMLWIVFCCSLTASQLSQWSNSQSNWRHCCFFALPIIFTFHFIILADSLAEKIREVHPSVALCRWKIHFFIVASPGCEVPFNGLHKRKNAKNTCCPEPYCLNGR